MDTCVGKIQGNGRKLSYKRHFIDIPLLVPIQTLILLQNPLSQCCWRNLVSGSGLQHPLELEKAELGQKLESQTGRVGWRPGVKKSEALSLWSYLPWTKEIGTFNYTFSCTHSSAIHHHCHCVSSYYSLFPILTEVRGFFFAKSLSSLFDPITSLSFLSFWQ